MRRRNSFRVAGVLGFVDLNTYGDLDSLARIHKSLERSIDEVGKTKYLISSGDYEEEQATTLIRLLENEFGGVASKADDAISTLEGMKSKLQGFLRR